MTRAKRKAVDECTCMNGNLGEAHCPVHMPSEPLKLCIKERMSDRYVERLIFNDGGIGIEFTSDMNRAARVERREVADQLAACIPLPVKVVPWAKSRKPQ